MVKFTDPMMKTISTRCKIQWWKLFLHDTRLISVVHYRPQSILDSSVIFSWIFGSKMRWG